MSESAHCPLQLSVIVSLGSPREARFPVLLGSCEGEASGEIEADFDLGLRQQLLANQSMGEYPEKLGVTSVFLSPGALPPGVVVAGLGPAGLCTPPQCREAVATAVVKYTLAPPASGQRLPEGLSSLLLGATGNSPLEVPESLRAVLFGVADGLRRLQKKLPALAAPGFTLELIEAHEDRAVQVLHLLKQIAAQEQWSTDGVQLQVDSALRWMTGARRGQAPTPPVRRSWVRLRVSRVGEGALFYELLSGRARVDQLTWSVPGAFLDPQLRELRGALHTGAPPSPETLMTLWKRIAPPQVREELAKGVDLELVVDLQTAEIPWELLIPGATRSGAAPPHAVEAGLVRRFATAAGRACTDSPTGPALVIRALAPEEQADAHVDHIASLLEGRLGRAVPLPRTPEARLLPLELANGLLARPWRVVYAISHGAQIFEREAGTGRLRLRSVLLLPPGGAGVGAAAEPMASSDALFGLDSAPEVVFLNACSVGNIRPASETTPGVAAGLAEELLRLGVRLVVVAGWPVDRAAAEAFAETWFQASLSGERFGEAVRQARARCHSFRGQTQQQTWAAWQCYGPPEHTLHIPQRRVAPYRLNKAIYSVTEALDLLDEGRDPWLATARADGVEARQQLQALEEKLPFATEGRVALALGDLHLDIGAWRTARERYEAAVQQDNPPLALLYRLADTCLEGASALWVRGSEEFTLWLADNARYTEIACSLGLSARRRALRAANLRRRAWLFCQTPKEQKEILASSLAEDRLALEQDPSVPQVAFHVAMTGALLGVPTTEAELSALARLIALSERQRPRFWVRMMALRLSLLRGVAGLPEAGGPTAQEASLADARSPREIWQIRTYLDFLEAMGAVCELPPERGLRDLGARFWQHATETYPGLLRPGLAWELPEADGR